MDHGNDKQQSYSNAEGLEEQQFGTTNQQAQAMTRGEKIAAGFVAALSLIFSQLILDNLLYDKYI
jgi:hypothetical protein